MSFANDTHGFGHHVLTHAAVEDAGATHGRQDLLIGEIEAKLRQSVKVEEQFTVRWRVI